MYQLLSISTCINQALTGGNYYEQLGLSPFVDRISVDYRGELVASRLDSAKGDPQYDQRKVQRAFELTERACAVLSDEKAKRRYDEILSSQIQSATPLHDAFSLDGWLTLIDEEAVPKSISIPPHEAVEAIDSTNEHIPDLSVGQVDKRAILKHARQYFSSFDWETATSEFNIFVARTIHQGLATPADFLGDAKLVSILSNIAVKIWSSYDHELAPKLYSDYVRSLQATKAVDVHSISQTKGVKKLVSAHAQHIWKCYDFGLAPEIYATFVERCVGCGVADKDTLGKECSRLALSTAQQIWKSYDFQLAPGLYASFLDQCVKAGVADREIMGQRCYPLVISMAQQIWKSYDFQLAPDLYARFVENCEGSRIATKSDFNRACYRLATEHIWGIVKSFPKEIALYKFENFMSDCKTSGVVTWKLIGDDRKLVAALRKLQS
jgi:hypothetical protein